MRRSDVPALPSRQQPRQGARIWHQGDALPIQFHAELLPTASHFRLLYIPFKQLRSLHHRSRLCSSVPTRTAACLNAEHTSCSNELEAEVLPAACSIPFRRALTLTCARSYQAIQPRIDFSLFILNIISSTAKRIQVPGLKNNNISLPSPKSQDIRFSILQHYSLCPRQIVKLQIDSA